MRTVFEREMSEAKEMKRNKGYLEQYRRLRSKADFASLPGPHAENVTVTYFTLTYQTRAGLIEVVLGVVGAFWPPVLPLVWFLLGSSMLPVCGTLWRGAEYFNGIPHTPLDIDFWITMEKHPIIQQQLREFKKSNIICLIFRPKKVMFRVTPQTRWNTVRP